MSKRSPRLKEVILALVSRRLAETCVALPARVEAYDAAKQVADVKPLLPAYRTVDGVQQAFSLPVIPHCPVKWPGGGGFIFASPLSAGDQVLLVFSDRALERWWASGVEQEPGDPRTHHLKDAFVLPELRASGHAIQGVPSGKAIIGKEGGPLISFGTDIRVGGDDATEAAVLGDQLKSYLDALVSALATFSSGLNAGTLTAQATALNTALGTALTALATYRSSLVKVK